MSNNGKTSFNISPVSKAIPFDNSINDFSSEESQSAIEEAVFDIKNVLYVNKQSYPGHFSTIKDALDSITDSDSYVIEVGPGIYTEDNTSAPITMSNSVTVKAVGHGTVTILPTNPNMVLFNLSGSGRRLQGVTISGVTGATAIKVTSSPSPIFLDYITISNCQRCIEVESSTTVTQAVFRNLRLISGSTTVQLLKISSSGGFASIVRIYSAIVTDDDGTLFEDAIFITGSDARIDPNTLLLRSTKGIGNGITLQDGASIIGTSGFEVDGFDKNLVTENVGAAPNIFISSVVLSNGITNDLQIDHTGTVGDIWGIFRLSKVVNQAPNTFTLGFQDPETGDINSSRIMATRGWATDLTNLTTFAGIHQLVSFDAYSVVVSGSVSGTIIQLPDATTLRNGHQFWIINAASVVINTRQFDGSNSFLVTQNTTVRYVLRDNSTSAGVWAKETTSSAAPNGVTPPFIFSKSGGAGVGAYLKTGEVLTSNTGQLIKGSNFIVELNASNSALVSESEGAVIQMQRRTGLNTFVDIVGATVTIPSGQFQGQNTGLLIPIGPNWEISCYNSGPRNTTDPVVTMFIIPQ